MTLDSLWSALQRSPVGEFVTVSSWAFPALESVHVIAISLVVGSIVIVDLRLLGMASHDRAVTKVSRDTLPWTWFMFGVAAMSGGLLFTAHAGEYAINPYFQWKLALIVLAGLNMAAFHAFTWRGVARWDDGAAPLAGKIAGGLSLLFWIGVVFLGRAVGFTLAQFQ
jgi:hypothetical protein